jgi:hypothetical protein
MNCAYISNKKYTGYNSVCKASHSAEQKKMQKDLHFIVDKHSPAIVEIYNKSVLQSIKTLDKKKLLAALYDKDSAPIFDDIDSAFIVFQNSMKELSAPIIQVLAGCGTLEAEYAMSLLRKLKKLPKDNPTILFDAFSSKAKKYLSKRTFIGMKNISDKKSLKKIVSGLLTNQHPTKVVGAIRDCVGLHDRFQKAVLKLREKLIDEGNYTAKEIDAICERKSWQLRKTRAEGIARTEAMDALNEARRENWDNIISDPEIGIDKNDIDKNWLTAKDDAVCDICSGMDGEKIPFDEEWVLPNGKTTLITQGHDVNCRCTDYITIRGGLAEAVANG